MEELTNAFGKIWDKMFAKETIEQGTNFMLDIPFVSIGVQIIFIGLGLTLAFVVLDMFIKRKEKREY